MSFHLGKPILAMIGVAIVSGGALWLGRAPEKRADLLVWVFAEPHYNTYTQQGPDGRSIVQQFEQRTGKSVDVKVVAYRALDVRLTSLFNADLSGPEVPDLVEIEISQIGKYFRPPLDQVGFLPLNELLKKSGWRDRIIGARFAPWSKDGVIFGVPHDVHPTTITFRKDLFEQAGIDLPAADTWPKFHEACLKFQQYWRDKGVLNRWAIELPQANAGYLNGMLLARRAYLIDKDGRIGLNDPKVAQTLAFYAQMAAGAKQIGSEVSPGDAVFSQDLSAGAVCALWTPDWRVAQLKQYSRPEMSGKVAMMPLPRFDPTDAPTTTYGGTMIGIPRRSKNPELAFALIQQLYLTREAIDAQQRAGVQILPPVIEMWKDSRYQQPDPFYGGQYVDRMFVELAAQIPPRYVSPESSIADGELSYVLTKAVSYVKRSGEKGLVEACQKWLDEEAVALRRRIEHGRFR